MLGINQPAVTIKQIEVSIIDEAFGNGWVEPEPPGRLTGKTVAVVGSGPAGLAAAQQLTRAGHTVAVFERDDRIGGLLRYGIPDFKMEKRHLEARLRQMQDEGTRFRAGVEIGVDISWDDLRARYDAVVIATGATVPRDLAIPGRDLAGVHFAMEYLVESNQATAGDRCRNQITAEGKHVIVIGGGDTGADCIGTAHRQGALSVTNLAIGKQPPGERPEHQPWPMTPTLFEVSVGARGGRRALLPRLHRRVPRQRRRRGARAARRRDRVRRRTSRPQERHRARDPRRPRADRDGLHRPRAHHRCEEQLRHAVHRRAATSSATTTSSPTAPRVFVAGDAGRGQSLIVWAIAEGRAAAAHVDEYLMGATALPAPVRPNDVAIGLQPA